jgi:hypothetical protein
LSLTPKDSLESEGGVPEGPPAGAFFIWLFNELSVSLADETSPRSSALDMELKAFATGLSCEPLGASTGAFLGFMEDKAAFAAETSPESNALDSLFMDVSKRFRTVVKSAATELEVVLETFIFISPDNGLLS